MSIITEQHRFELRRAGFTDRQINTLAQKFYNLRNVSPFTTEEYAMLTKTAEITRQRDELLAALEKVLEFATGYPTPDDGEMLADISRAAIAKAKP